MQAYLLQSIIKDTHSHRSSKNSTVSADVSLKVSSWLIACFAKCEPFIALNSLRKGPALILHLHSITHCRIQFWRNWCVHACKLTYWISDCILVYLTMMAPFFSCWILHVINTVVAAVAIAVLLASLWRCSVLFKFLLFWLSLAL